jgi:hypothetical protein
MNSSAVFAAYEMEAPDYLYEAFEAASPTGTLPYSPSSGSWDEEDEIAAASETIKPFNLSIIASLAEKQAFDVGMEFSEEFTAQHRFIHRLDSEKVAKDWARLALDTLSNSAMPASDRAVYLTTFFLYLAGSGRCLLEHANFAEVTRLQVTSLIYLDEQFVTRNVLLKMTYEQVRDLFGAAVRLFNTIWAINHPA